MPLPEMRWVPGAGWTDEDTWAAAPYYKNLIALGFSPKDAESRAYSAGSSGGATESPLLPSLVINRQVENSPGVKDAQNAYADRMTAMMKARPSGDANIPAYWGPSLNRYEATPQLEQQIAQRDNWFDNNVPKVPAYTDQGMTRLNPAYEAFYTQRGLKMPIERPLEQQNLEEKKYAANFNKGGYFTKNTSPQFASDIGFIPPHEVQMPSQESLDRGPTFNGTNWDQAIKTSAQFNPAAATMTAGYNLGTLGKWLAEKMAFKSGTPQWSGQESAYRNKLLDNAATPRVDPLLLWLIQKLTQVGQ